MKLLVVLSLVCLAVAEDTYSTENDDLDIEAVVKDDAALKAFYGCFVDSTPCNDVQDSFKKDLAEAIQIACTKCTVAQKHILKRFLEGLREKFPQDYEDFKKKFDPENKYFANLEKAIDFKK